MGRSLAKHIKLMNNIFHLHEYLILALLLFNIHFILYSGTLPWEVLFTTFSRVILKLETTVFTSTRIAWNQFMGLFLAHKNSSIKESAKELIYWRSNLVTTNIFTVNLCEVIFMMTLIVGTFLVKHKSSKITVYKNFLDLPRIEKRDYLIFAIIYSLRGEVAKFINTEMKC